MTDRLKNNTSGEFTDLSTLFHRNPAGAVLIPSKSSNESFVFDMDGDRYRLEPFDESSVKIVNVENGIYITMGSDEFESLMKKEKSDATLVLRKHFGEMVKGSLEEEMDFNQIIADLDDDNSTTLLNQASEANEFRFYERGLIILIRFTESGVTLSLEGYPEKEVAVRANTKSIKLAAAEMVANHEDRLK